MTSSAFALDDRVDALERWLAEQVPGFQGPVAIEQFGVGQSNPTYRLTTSGRAYVLRRKPPGTLLPSAHAVDREYRVIRALEQAAPVPKAYALCEDEAVIGSMFYVMELVEGRHFTDGALPGLEPTERSGVYRAMVETLARLHRIDPVAVGLGDYGRPGSYFTRQISRWARQYRSDGTAPIPAMERLADQLPASAPESDATAVVHGDYRLDNLIWAEGESRVKAILDWELSTLGDPGADLAYLLTNWVLPAELSPNRAGFGGGARPEGIPAMGECLALYEQTAGRPGLADLGWGLAFSLFRLAAIFHGIAGRARSGAAAGVGADTYGARVEPVAQIAWRCLDDPAFLKEQL